jgi:hypothetical protein
MTRWLEVTLLMAWLLCGCGARPCNPPGRLPTHFPGTCTELGTACSQQGFCEACGHAGEICCANNTCGADPMGASLTCQLPATIGSLDGVCR